MIPEAIVGQEVLACGRIAEPSIQSECFGGVFCPREELATRINDAKPKLILTAS